MIRGTNKWKHVGIMLSTEARDFQKQLKWQSPLGQGCPTGPPNHSGYCYCSQELGGKTSLLRKLHTLVTGHGEIKPGLTRKLPSFASSHSTGRWYAACCGRQVITSLTQMWNLWAAMMTNLAGYAQRSNSGTNVMWVTNWFLFVFQA